MKHEFVDAQEMHKKTPQTFKIPSQEELGAIKKGDSVKICIAGERFWVTVEKVTENNIEGFVDNYLINSADHHIFYGDFVEFEKKNIYDIIEA